MDIWKENQIKMVKKYYHIEDEKKEKNYHHKKLFFNKKMKIKKNIKTNFIKKYKWCTIYYNYNLLNYPRIKLIIKKNQIKLSTLRNKYRRIIYEYFRINQYNIKNIDFIFNINKNINKFNKTVIKNNINKIFKI